jgi:hypothetical protein
VDRHATVLHRYLTNGMLATSSVAVCLGGAQEVMALWELGVVGVVAVVAVVGDDRDLLEGTRVCERRPW